MTLARYERLAFRATIGVAACLMVGVWLRAGVVVSSSNATARADAAMVAARYVNAQESLSTVRTMVLLTSVRVREILLEPRPASVFEDRRQIEAAYRLVSLLLQDYEPVAGRASLAELLAGLSAEIDALHAGSLSVLAEEHRSMASVRDVLSRRIIPRRDAALAICDEIQTRNRGAFIDQQAGLAAEHEAADRETSWHVAMLALAGLMALLLASLYATHLESRVRSATRSGTLEG